MLHVCNFRDIISMCAEKYDGLLLSNFDYEIDIKKDKYEKWKPELFPHKVDNNY